MSRDAASRNGHLIRAEEAMRRARGEFERARKARDELGAGQSAEKAWLAVAEASHALFRLTGVPERKLPQGHQGVFSLLRRYAAPDMVRSFLHARGILHTEVFYRGAVDWPTVAETLAEAEGFVRRVRDAACRQMTGGYLARGRASPEGR